jgi:hypothetical protein
LISIHLDLLRLTRRRKKKSKKQKNQKQKPTGAVRVLSFAGTLALGGVLLYFWNQKEKQQKVFEEEERKRSW